MGKKQALYMLSDREHEGSCPAVMWREPLKTINIVFGIDVVKLYLEEAKVLAKVLPLVIGELEEYVCKKEEDIEC